MSKRPRKASKPLTPSKAEDELRALRVEQELKAEREAMRLTEEATAQAQADLELPDLEFDWSDLAWRDSQDISRALMAINEAQREYDADGQYVPREIREDAQEEAFDKMRFWFSRVCISVPLDWFTRQMQSEVSSGERTLDFTDPETFFELKDVRIGRLINAMNESRGNSEKN